MPEGAVTEPDLIRALRIIALSNEARLLRVGFAQVKLRIGEATTSDPDIDWFLEHVDDLAPELHRRGWVEYAEFTYTPGQVVVTTGNGDLRAVVATELGKRQLSAAVVA